jgi:hypothetical protein
LGFGCAAQNSCWVCVSTGSCRQAGAGRAAYGSTLQMKIRRGRTCSQAVGTVLSASESRLFKRRHNTCRAAQRLLLCTSQTPTWKCALFLPGWPFGAERQKPPCAPLAQGGCVCVGGCVQGECVAWPCCWWPAPAWGLGWVQGFCRGVGERPPRARVCVCVCVCVCGVVACGVTGEQPLGGCAPGN